MEEIKVGEYVRTKDSFIFKILTKEECNYGYHGMTDSSKKYSTYTYGKGSRNDIKNKIENHSFNIIDLIECGDYVNGHRIIMDLKQSSKHYGTANCFVTAKGYTFEENEIKTILTKEQFEQNLYKV